MNTVKCSAEGCKQVFSTTGNTSAATKFTCREHSKHTKAERPHSYSAVWSGVRSVYKDSDEN